MLIRYKKPLTLLVLLSLGANLQALRVRPFRLLRKFMQQMHLVNRAIKTVQNGATGAKNSLILNNFHLVHDGLFRSAQMTPGRLGRCIRQHQIKTIINLRGPNPGKRWWDKEHEVARDHGVLIVDIPLNSTQRIVKDHIQQILDTYRNGKERGTVLIHCRNGADRTSAVSAILDYNRTYDEKLALGHLSLKYGHIKEIKGNMDLSVKEWIRSMQQANFDEEEALKLYH